MEEKTLYMGNVILESVTLIYGKCKIKDFDLKLSEGMVGCIPVFDSYEKAEKWNGADVEITTLIIDNKMTEHLINVKVDDSYDSNENKG